MTMFPCLRQGTILLRVTKIWKFSKKQTGKKADFVRKNWRDAGESLLKNGTKWLRLLTMLFQGRIHFARGPWLLGDFCNVFLPNSSEDQKKSYY